MKDVPNMTDGELKNWLADRLRMRSAASADVELRRDEAPYERPLQLWKTTEGNWHQEFLRAVLALVEEAAGEPWEPESFDQLARLIEAGRIGEAATALEALAHSRRLLGSENGAQLQMQALRTLLALGWTGSLEFWQAQRAVVGDRWPGLVFKGLARQSLDAAFGELPSLAVDAKAMRQILDLFPGLMRDQKLTISNLREMSRRVVDRIPRISKSLILEWFALRNVPLTPAITFIHDTLESALDRALGEVEAAPRSYDAALVSPGEPELDHPIEIIEKALSIRKQIEALQETLNRIYGGKAPEVTGTAAVVRRGGGRPRKTAVVEAPGTKVDGHKAPRSAAARARMAAAAKARWAARKGAVKGSAKSAAPANTAASSIGRKKKRTMSPEARARIAAAQRARWAKLKG